MTTVINRKDYREVVADELEALLVGSGKPLQALYGYAAPTFNRQSPVATVESVSSGRDDRTDANIDTSDLFIGVMLFAEYADAQEAYYSADSEDALDDAEQIVAQWVFDNRSRNPAPNATGATWIDLSYVTRTEKANVLIGGITYRHEQIILRFTVSPDG